MLWTKILLCSICKGHVSERTSKLVAWWSPNHDLEQNGNAHPNNLMKKRKTDFSGLPSFANTFITQRGGTELRLSTKGC